MPTSLRRERCGRRNAAHTAKVTSLRSRGADGCSRRLGRFEISQQLSGVFEHVDSLTEAAVATGFAERRIDGRHALAIFSIDISAVVDEELDHVVPSPTRRFVKCCESTTAVVAIDICASGDQQLE